MFSNFTYVIDRACYERSMINKQQFAFEEFVCRCLSLESGKVMQFAVYFFGQVDGS